jgi:TldD protein
MTLPLQLAESRLLLPAGLDASGLERTFGSLLGPGIDFGDLYFQHARRESWTVEDGIVKDGAHSIEQGVGVRAISGEKTGFAYSDEINSAALIEASTSARAIARDGNSLTTRSLVRSNARALYAPVDPIDSLGNEDKVEALRRIDKLLRAADPRVKQVMVSLAGGVDTVLIARSDGVLAADVRPLVRFNVQVIVEQNGRRESGYTGGGGRYSYAELFADGKPEAWGREALRQALVNLEAVDAPAGVMPVVLGNGWPGVLLHEAVGHGLEGDFNRKGTSTYAGRMGQRVAAPGVTIVDDGTLPGRRGSLNIDDEGTRTECTTRIEDGRITAPVKGATLIGNGPETMQKVRMVGHDLALDEGVGVCGKDGQSVPVGVGQPSLLIDGITVGGTQA